MTPRAAPPAPSNSTRAPRSGQPRLTVEIAHQTRAVGVVAEHAYRALRAAARERVDGTGAPRARRQRVGQLQGGLLVRHGDVEPAAAAG